jgi:hypothetical protein
VQQTFEKVSLAAPVSVAGQQQQQTQQHVHAPPSLLSCCCCCCRKYPAWLQQLVATCPKGEDPLLLLIKNKASSGVIRQVLLDSRGALPGARETQGRTAAHAARTVRTALLSAEAAESRE